MIINQETANWRLGFFFCILCVNAVALAILLPYVLNPTASGAIFFLVWAMLSGVSSTWLAIVHVLRCRAKSLKKWQLFFYLVPSATLLLCVPLIDIPEKIGMAIELTKVVF
ncbi:MAG: hypothetical protein NE330_00920 [Lentisphaeraceae bacterium]|nr:hypothetical protein [Lentisphaeraceae bacterium]